MDPTRITEVLRTMSCQRHDSADFQSAVWREIRHRRALGESPRFWAEVWLPSLRGVFAPAALASLIVAALLAWAVGASWNTTEARREEATARNLNLGVFGPQANGLAHDLLVANQ